MKYRKNYPGFFPDLDSAVEWFDGYAAGSAPSTGTVTERDYIRRKTQYRCATAKPDSPNLVFRRRDPIVKLL